MATLSVLAPAFLTTACSEVTVTARAGDKLVAGTTYSADLDGDIDSELLLVDEAAASVTITDGNTVYQSRDKWRVVEACLGDTDRNGLLEVVALLDGDDGRHLGLFAYFGGEYRERLVTRVLTPRPLSLRVLAGDLLELTEEPLPGQSGSQLTIYRWNGFGFTAIDPAVSP